MASRDTVVGIAIGALAGAAIGVAIGLLYAPQSGDETRTMLKEKAAGLKARASDLKDCVSAAVRGDNSREEA